MLEHVACAQTVVADTRLPTILPSRWVKLLFWNGSFCSCTTSLTLQQTPIYLVILSESPRYFTPKTWQPSCKFLSTESMYNKWLWIHTRECWDVGNSNLWMSKPTNLRSSRRLRHTSSLKVTNATAKLVFTIALFSLIPWNWILKIGMIEFCIIFRAHSWKVIK